MSNTRLPTELRRDIPIWVAAHAGLKVTLICVLTGLTIELAGIGLGLWLLGKPIFLI